MKLSTLFEEAVLQKASDIHLATGQIPCLRVAGDLVRLDLPALDTESFEALMEPAMTPESWVRVRSGLPVERTVSVDELNFSLVAFRASENGFAATFRIISADIPSLEKIGEGAMPLMEQIVEMRRGLVLISGPTGSGKCTTAYAIVDTINARRADRIFVVESGPNYTFQSKQGLVTQLHVGQDLETYERALAAVHRADPDVVVVDDIPTTEALRQIMILAETGHLVIANLHADSVTDGLQRLFHAAGGDTIAFHRAIAQNLCVLTVQRLFRKADNSGRVAAYEWLSNTPAVKEALLAGDLKRLAKLQASEPESRTLKGALDEFVQLGTLTEEAVAPYRQE